MNKKDQKLIQKIGEKNWNMICVYVKHGEYKIHKEEDLRKLLEARLQQQISRDWLRYWINIIKNKF